MSLYSLALFLHVTGALLLFVTLTVEGIALRLLRRAATAAEATGASAMLRVNRIVGPISAVGVLVPGLYMTATSWGAVAWIVVALISWPLIAVLGAFNGIRILALQRSSAHEGGPSMMAQLRNPLFLVSWLTRVGIALGVIFLMTVKPGGLGSVIAVVLAAGAGMAVGVGLSAGRFSRGGQVA
jgi:hypothetical protein